jgi:glycine/D-amino acid oxidase-like deaminating enzyme
MDLSSGLPFWLVKNGLPYDYPQLDKNINCDVAILGGGITAAINALILVEAGIPCVLIEKRSIGLGSTIATTALLQYQIDTPLSKLIELRGEEQARKAYLLCAESIGTLAKISKKVGYLDFEIKPSLYFASYKKDVGLLKKEYALHKSLGLNIKYWDEDKIKEKMGFSAPAALYSGHSAQIDAYKFCHLILQYCIGKGLKVYDRSEMVDIKHSKSGVVLKSIQGHKVNCKKLVYATGFEVVNLIDKKIVQLMSTWAIVSQQIEHKAEFWHKNCLIWESKETYVYIRTTADNRIMLGGRDEATNNPKVRIDKLELKTKQLADDFAKLFPKLRFQPEFSWAGTFGVTKDGLPFIGHYEPKPNGLFSLGFGGNGITFSVIAAEIIRDILLEKANPNETIFAFDR